MKRLIGIHFLEREDKVTQVAPHLFETGDWARIGNPDELIGGAIHLHRAQGAPSHRSGIITGYRSILDPTTGRQRRIFAFVPTPAGVYASDTEGNWGTEQKRIYADEETVAA